MTGMPNILNLDYTPPKRYRTGIKVFDECFQDRVGNGIGLAVGSLNLLTGKPGLGKTTLAIHILDGLTASNCFTIFATNEQTQDSVIGLAKAIDLKNGFNAILEDQFDTETILKNIEKLVLEHRPIQLVLAIDSLQGLNLDQRNASKRAWEDLERFAKATNTIILLINHLRKDNVIAGAAVIKQRCDCVMELQRGSCFGEIELSIEKNRYGLSGITIDGMLMGRRGINFNSADTR